MMDAYIGKSGGEEILNPTNHCSSLPDFVVGINFFYAFETPLS